MSDEFDEPIDITEDMLEPGKQLKPAPKPVTPYQAYHSEPMPARLSPEWVEGQLPKELWKANRSAINPRTVVFMVDLRAQGLSKKGVMARMGLAPNTWHAWMKKAQAGEQPYLLWSQCIGTAEADMEEEMMDNVRNAAQSDWKAAKWVLERMQPEEYSDKAGGGGISIHGDVNVNNKQTTVNSLSLDEVAEIMGVFGEIDITGSALTVEAEVVEDEQ